MSERVAKQVIVMRKDLNMRKGKMVAQGSHASLGAWLLIHEDMDNYHNSYGRAGNDYSFRVYEAAESWIGGTFTKICVGVASEDELLRVFDAAESAGLPVKLITDAGHTEFHGVPTRTCLAIGPAWAEDIDKITGELPLL